MILNINNEYNKLIKVVLSPVDKEYLKQQEQLINILNKYNIEVLMTKRNNKAKYQMFTRDPFIVIGDTILLNHMKEDFRQIELPTFNDILKDIDKDKIIYLDKETIIEGGDLLIHNDIIFIGQNGNRTNKEGLEYLRKNFTNYKIIPLNMINPNPYIPFVHLDCIFNIVSNDTAIIYKEGFTKESLSIIEKLFPNLISITTQEQDELASNVISLGNKVVIVQKRHTRIIEELTNLGFTIETMDIYETIKETGYNRCLTCPLERE